MIIFIRCYNTQYYIVLLEYKTHVFVSVTGILNRLICRGQFQWKKQALTVFCWVVLQISQLTAVMCMQEVRETVAYTPSSPASPSPSWCTVK